MKKRTIEDIKKELKQNTELELLSTEYINRKTPMLFKCKKCGRIFKTTLASILANKKSGKYKKYCNICSAEILSQKNRRTHEEFIREVNTILGNDYEVLTKYINSKTKVKILHKKCGYIWNVVPYAITYGKYKCPKCYNTIKKTTASFKKEIFDLFGDEYEVIGEYKNYHTPIEIKHKKCNRIFKIQPANFITSKCCPLCSKDRKSKGEEKIAEILTKMNIKFEREKRFEDCKNKRPLPFDFFLTDRNIIIEYDGEQHFKPKFNKESFENIRLTDKIKNIYCKEKNIKLIRIPYTEFNNIEQILEEHLQCSFFNT